MKSGGMFSRAALISALSVLAMSPCCFALNDSMEVPYFAALRLGKLACDYSIAKQGSQAGGGYSGMVTNYGILIFAEATGETALREKLKQMYPTGKSIETGHVDKNVFGIVPLELYRQTGIEQYRQDGLAAANQAYASLNGNGHSHLARYWSDDMYMLGSLMAQAHKNTADDRYATWGLNDMGGYYDRLQLANGLLKHTATTPPHWGRANGWAVAGVAELLSTVPADHAKRERVMRGWRTHIDSLLHYRDEQGRIWRQLLDDKEAWLETSCTGMFLFGMGMGLEHGWLVKEQYVPAFVDAWDAFIDYVDQIGRLHQACVGTSTGDRQYYLERERSGGDFHGQAPLIWASTSIIRFCKNDQTPPSGPANCAAVADVNNIVTLSWNAASDTETGVALYRIYRDGTLIASVRGGTYSDGWQGEGATLSYTVSAVDLRGNEGARSAPVSVTIPADTKAPAIAAAWASDDRTITIAFDEPVEKTSAETAANYSVDKGISVDAASLDADMKTVRIRVTPFTGEGEYTVSATGIKDRASSANTSGAQQKKIDYAICSDNFYGPALNAVWVQKDADNWDGTTFSIVNEQLEIGARGKDMYATTLEYAAAVRKDLTGDFDVSVKIVSLDNTSGEARAGFIVANDIDDFTKGGLFTLAITHTGFIYDADMVGAVGQYSKRVKLGDLIPPQFPCWMRLVKQGRMYTVSYSYTSAEGPWNYLEKLQTPQKTDSTAQFGLLVCSRNVNQTCKAVFDDFRCWSCTENSITAAPGAATRLLPGPRPVISAQDGMLRVRFPNPSSFTVRIYSAAGKTVLFGNGTNSDWWTGRLDRFGTGMFIVRVRERTEETVGKIVISR
jgi:rhamnogalacturonyl hydrolase YesR